MTTAQVAPALGEPQTMLALAPRWQSEGALFVIVALTAAIQSRETERLMFEPPAPRLLSARERWLQRVAEARAREAELRHLPQDAERNAEAAEFARALAEGRVEIVGD